MPEPKPTQPVLGSSIALWRADEVLVVKRRNPPRRWSLPGGRVEWGERLVDAAIRELYEESGLSVNEAAFVGIIEAIEPAGTLADGSDAHHFVVGIHTAIGGTGVLCASDDALDARWVTIETLKTMDTTVDLVPMVIKARDVATRLA